MRPRSPYDPSSGGRRVGDVCTKHVAERLYVDSTVSHPSAAQRRPFSSRATERFPRSGVPNRTSLLPRAISPPCPSNQRSGVCAPRPPHRARARTASITGGDVQDRPRVWLFGALLALPLAGLALLLAVPSIDVMWEHHPSHFLLVLGVALINVGLAAFASEAAHRRADARLFLVSLALIMSSGFLALHALATPGVLLDHPNSGFAFATPIGLLLASGFAAASAVELGRAEAATILSHRTWIRGALALLLIAWAIGSLA